MSKVGSFSWKAGLLLALGACWLSFRGGYERAIWGVTADKLSMVAAALVMISISHFSSTTF